MRKAHVAAPLYQPFCTEAHSRGDRKLENGSPLHISWLGEPTTQLAAAPPDIALLSWEHGSSLFKNKKYF
jgi:hypothetical protein